MEHAGFGWFNFESRRAVDPACASPQGEFAEPASMPVNGRVSSERCRNQVSLMEVPASAKFYFRT